MTNNPSPTTIFKLYLQFELPLVGFPSGQREQTVNLPSSTSKVRFERSEKALPQATTRRVKRAALSNPSPTTITSVAYLIPAKHSVSYLSVREG